MRKGTIFTLFIILSIIFLAGCSTLNGDSSKANSEAATVTEPREVNVPDSSEVGTVTEPNGANVPNGSAVGTIAEENEVEPPENPDFHSSAWGMTMDEVKKVETNLQFIDEEPNALTSSTTSVAGKNANLIFSFDDSGLTAGMIYFELKHSNDNLYIEDFEDIRKALTEKYGAPIIDKQVWKDDLFMNSPDDWGVAVAAGHLQYLAQWEMENNKISLYLTGDNYNIELVLIYLSDNYQTSTNTDGL